MRIDPEFRYSWGSSGGLFFCYAQGVKSGDLYYGWLPLDDEERDRWDELHARALAAGEQVLTSPGDTKGTIRPMMRVKWLITESAGHPDWEVQRLLPYFKWFLRTCPPIEGDQ